jgi:trk system potassium uptake protein TrkH
MGFIVLFDVWQWLTKKKPFITFTSKIILWVTIILTVFGTLMILFFEPSIRAFTASQKLLVSFFQAENALTTTGFNSIPIGILSEGILMILTILMYVGASPSGTGGGLKSTTLTGLIGYINSKLKRRHNVTFFHREIPEERVSIAINIFIIYTSVLFFGSCLLTFTEKAPLQNLLFEAASALGTVGLSVGVTNSLSFAGKIILTSLMFIGRAGVITIGTVVLLHRIRLLREGTKMEDLAV